MKIRLQSSLIVLLCCGINTIKAQSISVTDNISAQDLVQNYLINSSCANVSNFSASGGDFGVMKSYGIFTNTTPTFSFTNGIILSTGRAISATGPNDSLLSEGATTWLGDIDLEQSLSISGSINASVLEFDFVPITNRISFDYIFSSEQYLSNPTANQCNFTDGFAFLLKEVGGGSPYQNLALIPGTSTPVKVNTVRGSGTICPPANETYFGAFNGNTHPTNFNGQTVPMKAQANVTPGLLYHIKLVIADQGNNLYDSAIFLASGSFKSITDLGTDRLVSTNNPYCVGENITLNATQPGAIGYKWFKDGVDTGITSPTFTITDNTNTSAVVYKVEVSIGSITCISEGEIKIQFSDLPLLSNQTLVQCDDNNDGSTIFNLSKLDNLIRNNSTTLGSVIYKETIGGLAIANPMTYQSTNATIYAEVANAYGCKSTAVVTLQISNNVVTSPIPFKKCDDDADKDGKTTFNLTTEISPLITGLPAGLTFEYYTSENDAILQNNQLANVFINDAANQQSIFARILNGSDCYGITEIQLTIAVFIPNDFEEETFILCKDDILTLSVPNIYNNYAWSNTDGDFETEISDPGNYSVEVTNADGCKATKKFIVKSSAPATNINANTNDFNGNQNSLTITYNDNGGDYIFSIDGINYQESPLFTNLSEGEYTIYVKDKNGCLPIPLKTIYILDYPKYFTPNGDGINDNWMVKNLNSKSNSTISIFDRYGKFLKQLDPKSTGWNGIYNGKQLPASDYWFILTLFNNKTIKGNFSLKR